MSVEDIEPYLQQLIDNQATGNGLLATVISGLSLMEDEVIAIQGQLVDLQQQVSDHQILLIVLLVGLGVCIGVLAFSQFWRQVWK